MQPSLFKGTQGEERRVTRENEVPPPILGRLGACGEPGLHQQFGEPCSTKMFRVPGPSGDSGFHRGSLSKDVTIKSQPGMEVSENEGTPQKREVKESPDDQGFGRGFNDEKVKEEEQ